MKVLMTADAVGGVWTYATDLAVGLRASGIEVVLGVLGPAPDRGSLDLYSGDIRLLSASMDWTADTPEAVLASGAAVADLAARERVDVVHLNSPALAAGGAFDRPVLGVCHSDVRTWWAAVRGGGIDPDLAWRAELTGRGYATCDALVAPSRAFAEVTAAAFGLAVPTVVYNGRGGPRASSSQRAECARSSGGVFTAGRLWDDGKGMAVLDCAAARLSAPVQAAGPLRGPHGGEAAFRHLVPLGRLSADAVAEHLRAAAVFCSPALYEPFGLAVLEAAQAARPLVLSDIPTFRELWEGAAVFTPAGDSDALADALEGLLGDPHRRATLGEAARRRAERFTVEAMTAGYLAAYAALAPAARAAA